MPNKSIIDKTENLITIFDQATDKFSEEIAVKSRDFTYTYKEYFNASCHFAAHLDELGVAKGEMVGICLERSAEMGIGILGILRVGATYVPVDPEYPTERIVTIFQDANVQWVVTTPNLVDFVKSLGYIPVVPCIDISDTKKISFAEIKPTDIAVVLFTSGSTGVPKGALISHYAIVNLINYTQSRYPLSPGDVILFKSPYTFDISVWELFGWMKIGGILFITQPGEEKNPGKLVHIIEEQNVSFLFFVPSMLSAFLDYYSSIQKNKVLYSLKWISVGGEVLPVSTVDHFYQLFDGERVKLINVYGPTETTIYATTFLCDPHTKYTKLPIGEIVTNDFVYILNDKLEEVPQGEEGEICIGGAGVANGYLNRPELTAEKFVPDPFAGVGNMYRTGDNGRRLENGLFDFIGRKDFQIKLRGQRIEIGEIEHALQQIPEIKESLVVFTKDRHGDNCLVAYIKPNAFSDDAPKDQFYLAESGFVNFIKNNLLRFLPKYMVPSEIVICRSFPLTMHGKIDRKALIPISELHKDSEADFFIPQTEVAHKVYEIWKEVLGRKSIGGEETFFTAGGHSLKAVQVITNIIKTFGCDIPLKEFYKDMTLQKMSELIENKDFIESSEIDEFVTGDPNQKIFPITPVQREMWVMNNIDSTGII